MQTAGRKEKKNQAKAQYTEILQEIELECALVWSAWL